VTAMGTGTATITATTADGTNLTATCLVTVVQPVTGITVAPATATLTVGGTAQLTATVTPATATNPAVTWKSNAPTVATVSSTGKVTARGVGTAVITATTKDGTELSATCQVTVVQPATSIALNKTETTIAVGLTETLVATVLPDNATNKAVAWTTSDATVAVVDQNGTVTAVAAGQAVITATTTDGTNLSASCQVTVTEVLATSLSLNKTFVGLVRGETVTLTAIVQPDDTTNPAVEWTSNDATIATVDQNGTVTAKAVGMTTIIARTTDGSGLVAACTVRVCPHGDINLDGKVDIDDVNIVINIMLEHDQASNYDGRADVNDDGKVDVSDMNELINILLDN
ncbi:MAG: Ig-like domain-containing protein, partial [Muribaculaceae bacterium]|nr:Ig-like domain-containing protein [Muribaculaceae bacterium]